jgi:hypothetical protein
MPGLIAVLPAVVTAILQVFAPVGIVPVIYVSEFMAKPKRKKFAPLRSRVTASSGEQ